MSKADKRLEKARNNPRGWHFEELKKLYESFDFEVSSAKGSHFVARHPKLKRRQTFIKHRGELPVVYVTDAIELIDELLALEED